MTTVQALLWPITPGVFLLWQLFWLPLLLALLYIPGVQATRDGWYWKPFIVFAAPALLIDWWLNYTTFAVYLWDWPLYRERTLSTRIKQRLQFYADERGDIARAIKTYCNFFKADHI